MSGCDPARRIAHERLIERLRNAPGGDPEAFVNLAWSALATSGVSWIGFYRVADDGQSMVLEQCRDRPACSPIGMHGVCGQAIRRGRTRVIADVADLGAEYVACDPRDRSEIVIPIRGLSPSGMRVDRVLDLDSFEAGSFSDLDDYYLRLALEIAGFAPTGGSPSPPPTLDDSRIRPG